VLPLEALERRGSVGGVLKLHQRLALPLHAARQSQAAGGESPLSVLSRTGEITLVLSGLFKNPGVLIVVVDHT